MLVSSLGSFPHEFPGLFQELFNQADKFNIEIISIEPEMSKKFESQVDSKTDLVFSKVPIELKLEAKYRSLAEFLKELFENSEYTFSFDKLVITKLRDSTSKLKIDLLLGAFILSHKGALDLEKDLERGVNLHLRKRR